MPITEVVRVLAEGQGTDASGSEISVRLVYDVDGQMGPDADAKGYPRYWLLTENEGLGPFDDEAAAIAAAASSYRLVL